MTNVVDRVGPKRRKNDNPKYQSPQCTVDTYSPCRVTPQSDASMSSTLQLTGKTDFGLRNQNFISFVFFIPF